MTARSTDVAQVEAQARTCDHHWIGAHQPDFPDAVYWIDQCSLCGTYNGERLSGQIVDLVESRERAIRWAVTLESQNAAMEARIVELQQEMAARVTPPHLDGAYREGIYTGLQLAWRIINGQPDENHPGVADDDPGPYVSTYPTARLGAALTGSTE